MIKIPRTLRVNAAANFVGYLASAVITLFLTPVVIGSLGDIRYGVWALFGQLVGYYGLLDMGIRGALSHYIARYSAQSDLASQSKSICSAFWTLVGAGCLVVIGAIGLAIALPHLFDLGDTDISEARTTLLVMSLTLSTSLPLAVFHSILVGKRRFDLINLIEVSTRLLGAVVIYFVLTQGGGLIELSFIQAGTMLLTGFWIARTAYRIADKFELHPTGFERASLKKIFNYGIKNSALNISGKITHQMDLVVVGIFLGVQWVTFYRIGEALIGYASNACKVFTLSFTPELTHLHAQDKYEELNQLFLTGVRLVSLFIVCLFVNLILFGEAFITLWLGEAYVSGDWAWRSSTIMIVLALANLVRMLHSMSWQLLFAAQKQGFLIYVVAGEAMANLILSVILVQKIGLIGVALGTLIPLYVTNLFIVPAYVLRTFKITWHDYLVHGIGRPLLVTILVAISGYVIISHFAINTWLELIKVAMLSVGVCAIIGILFGLVSQEQKALFKIVYKTFRRSVLKFS